MHEIKQTPKTGFNQLGWIVAITFDHSPIYGYPNIPYSVTNYHNNEALV